MCTYNLIVYQKEMKLFIYKYKINQSGPRERNTSPLYSIEKYLMVIFL